MPLIFSKSCQYATQAVLFLARQPVGRPVLLREISENLEIPHHFLNKVLQILTRDGVVVSHRGLNGGFSLGRPASMITLNEIIRAVDGEAFLTQCVLGFPRCGHDNPCPVHAQWVLARDAILEMMNQKTIAQLSQTD